MIPGIPTTVLVAPDSFKGTLTATQVAKAVGRGLEDAGRPVDLCPIADGGEGTLEALLRALDGERRTVVVSDPLGRPVEAEFGIGEAGRGKVVGIVEMASASGLGLVDPAERDPFAASTFGTGQLIMAAQARWTMRAEDLAVLVAAARIAAGAWIAHGGQAWLATNYPPANGFYVEKEGM